MHYINKDTILFLDLIIVVSYLLGSINFAIIFTKIFAKQDVRDHGSGNAGMTNVIRTAGKLPGILTLVFDMLKAVASVFFAMFITTNFIHPISADMSFLDPKIFGLFAALFCIIGHFFPVFHGFKGGKGVASSAGIILALDWRVFLIAIGIFLISFLITKIVSISSILAAISFPIGMYFFTKPITEGFLTTTTPWIFTQNGLVVLLSSIIALCVIAKHKENIVRLFNGTEKKLSSKK